MGQPDCVIDVVSGEDVISDDPVGRQGGIPVAELVLVLEAALVLGVVGVTTWVVVFVVAPGEAVRVTVTMTVVGFPPIIVVLVDVTVS